MSLRWRAIWVGLLAGVMLYYALPTFFSDEERQKNDFIPDQGINWGLDLQGGIHWLLRIDVDKAVQQELLSTQTGLRSVLDEKGKALALVTLPEGQAALEVSGELEGVQDIIEEQYEIVDVSEADGKLRLTLTEAWKKQVTERGVQQAMEVLRERVDGLGVREPVLAPQGSDRILVQMPGEIDPKRARSILEQTTFLEFKLVHDMQPNEELLRAAHPEIPETQQMLVSHNEDDTVAAAYLVDKAPVLTGARLIDARIGFHPRNQRPLVNFAWDSEGTEIFRDFTGEHTGEQMAIVIDNKVISAPVIQERIGQRGQITGQFTDQEAADLAVSLRSGALPIPLIIEEERSIGPALGQDSIEAGARSMLMGALIVVVFMVVYYRTSGLLANISLLLNMVIILGLMGMAGATLTLPGFAGLVLTLVTAVDANVIIFERIREELRAGKTERNAVTAGFQRSRLTILDANLTAMIAALVLLYYGRGPVQGFGVTLAIGIVSSVFTAMTVTHVLIDIVFVRTKTLRI